MRTSLVRWALAAAGVFCFVYLTEAALRADDWPQWLGPKRDGVWRESGLIDTFPKGGPPVKWRKSVGAGYAGPAVANGRVYVPDFAPAKGTELPKSGFDMKNVPNGVERLLCFRESDGELLWQKEYPCSYRGLSYPAGPRTTPAVDHGKVYTLGAVGDLYCFDAEKGDVVWHKNLPKEYGINVPLWGFAGHPLVDGNRLICLVGGKGSTVVAFDKNTGRELWKNLTAGEPGYAPPMIYEHGGKRLLILWDAESVNALNPETGAVYWSQPFGTDLNKLKHRQVKAGMSIASPRLLGDLLYVSCFYNGSLMLKLGTQDGKPTATKVWGDKGTEIEHGRTTGLHAVMMTPVLKDGYIYGSCSYGEFRCLKADTGERIWETFQPTSPDNEPLRWGTAFVVEQGDRYFLFNEHGDLMIAKLSPKGYQEISRAHILDPTNTMAGGFGRAKRLVLWSHPAFADRCMFARNDREIVCVSLAAK